MRAAYATFVRNWIVIRRAYPWSFFIGTLLSGLYTVVLAYFTYHILAGGQLGTAFRTYAGTADYVSYVVVGAGVYMFAVRMLLGVGRSLITERREGTLESLLLAPAERWSYFIGVTVQWAAASAAELMVMLLLTVPLGLQLATINPWTFLLTMPVALLGIWGMSMVLGAIMLATRDTYITQNTLFAAMALIGGFTFPPQYLPRPLAWLGAALPVTGDLRLIRAALLHGAAPAAVLVDLIVYAMLGLLYVLLGLRMMRWAERRALEGNI